VCLWPDNLTDPRRIIRYITLCTIRRIIITMSPIIVLPTDLFIIDLSISKNRKGADPAPFLFYSNILLDSLVIWP